MMNAMKPTVARLTLFGLFLLVFSFGLRGQDPAQPNVELKKDALDPFDAKNRRILTASESDLELLKKHSIDASAESLVEFFRKRSLTDAERPKMAALVEQLGSPEFRTREKATEQLLKQGPAVLEFLRKGAKGADLELIRRAESCADRIRAVEPPAEVAVAAARVLLKRNPSELVTVLLAYLPYAESDHIADEVRATLRKSSRIDGQAHPELVAALTEDVPVRRAAAGEALAGVKEQAANVKRLLKDADPLVRVRVAEALILANDKSAVPTLIDALPLVTASQAWAGEDLLMRMSEGKNPPMLSRVGNDAARQKYKDSWSAWWTRNEKTIDLAKLHDVPELLGHTVVVLLDLGRILELNAKNETVWQIDGVVFPLDVQLLPNGNVLVAEYHAGRVTERDRFRGEIKWEKAIAGPLMAQRLPNRNTFIATDSRFFEVDDKGVEVLSYSMPGGERLMKVSKLPNGEVVALTSDSRVVRMDEKGKEISSFTVNLSTRLFGGRIHVLPNGRVLVPHNSENKVVEYDGQGQIVWEVSVPMPVAAMRLPNGNTLVTTYQPQTGAMEFDKSGRETDWNYRHNTRVTRAIRR